MSTRQFRTTRGRRRRTLLLLAGLLVVAGAVVAGLSLRDLQLARTRVSRARGDLAAASADPARYANRAERDAGIARLSSAASQLETASADVRGSVPLRLAAVLPGVSYQRAGLLQLIEDARDVASAARRVLEAGNEFEVATPGEPTVPLDRVATFEAVVAAAGRDLGRATRGERSLWGPLAEARRNFDEVSGPASARLTEAAETMRALRGFFGEGGTRRYFVAGMNNAEMRAQGMVLSYAIARFEGGRLTIERSDPIETLFLPQPAPIELPAGTSAVFGPLLPAQEWRSVNATADFSLTGRSIQAMYEQATGQRLDGVVGVDVTTLAAVLEVTGPVQAPGFPTLSKDTAVPFLLSGQYDGLGVGVAQRARRDQVAEVADVVANRLKGGGFDRIGLGRKMGDAAAGRHLLVWSASADEQEVFDRAGLGGAPGDVSGEPRETFHVAVEDASAAKLDYYVRPRIAMDVRRTGAGALVVRTTVTVRNEAPVGAAPSYALGPNVAATARPGQYVARVYLWGPAGSTQLDSVAESGLRLSQKALVVEPASEAVVEFETVIEARKGRSRDIWVVPQPRHVPMPIEVIVRGPGGAKKSTNATLARTVRVRARLVG